MTEPIEIGVLGATGTVGARALAMLQGHPWFRLTEVGASPDSAGRSLGEAMPAGEEARGTLPAEVLSLPLKAPEDPWSAPILLSALPSAIAGPVEEELARRGHVVVSNAASHRMAPHVPLIIPEINPDHLDLLRLQESRWPGALVANPNCSAVGLAVALAPLHRAFGLSWVSVATLKALSGAGRPGPSAADMQDNVVPYIGGEEEKLAQESQKVLGELSEGGVRPAEFPVSAQVHRVAVSHGHLLAVTAKLERPAAPDEVAAELRAFRGAIVDERLPSAPDRLIEVRDEPARPQPRLDRDRGWGMTVTVGRVRASEVADVKFSVLVHNLVRGAAGAALLNAEFCHVCGCTQRGRTG